LKIEAITEALRVIYIMNHTDLHLDQKHIAMLNVLRVDLSDHLDDLAKVASEHANMLAALKYAGSKITGDVDHES